MQQAHAIGLAMYSYANDNRGKYPVGRSSTEVFQQLLDSDYIRDPDIFYVPMPGKSKPVAHKLQPENVSWDVTCGATLNSPGSLPLVFLTGYRVSYAPGSSAIPVIKPYPAYQNVSRTWAHWWNGEPAPQPVSPGIVVFCVNNTTMFMHFSTDLDPDGSIPHFIPPDFKPGGIVYHQLTPDGVMRP